MTGYQTAATSERQSGRPALAELLEAQGRVPAAEGGRLLRRPGDGRLGRQGQQEALTEYDRVPYPGHPFAQTHPDRLATVATLFGLEPAPPTSAACSSSGAARAATSCRWPTRCLAARSAASTCPGARSSGRRRSAALGLGNSSSARPTSRAPKGEFDYVVAHGVYSWIEPQRRDALLAACRDRLAPQGVAYVSYDVLPGGYLREITRRMLRWHLRGVDDPAERIVQARALLGRSPPGAAATSCDGASRARPGPGRRLAVPRRARPAPRGGAVRRLRRPRRAPRPALPRRGGRLRDEHGARGGGAGRLADDVVAREQYLDFFKGRMFRQTLLRHAGAPPRGRAPRPCAACSPPAPSHPAGERPSSSGPGGAR